jgi:hypothetical protein
MSKPLMRSKPAPVDLVSIVREQLSTTTDPAKQSFLIDVAANLLRRRQEKPRNLNEFLAGRRSR